MNNIFDLIIIGGGPAGTSAAVYAARKQLKTLMIIKDWGGQSAVSVDIENWIGTPHISGYDLMKSFKNHVKANIGEYLSTYEDYLVTKIEKTDDGLYKVFTEKDSFLTRAILIASGSNRRKLDIPGADTLEHKGLTYCASCDGPIFKNQDVVVVGGGNAGFDSALQLLAYCRSVTLLSRGEPRADEITINSATSHQNFTLIANATPTEVLGTDSVTGLKYKAGDTEKELACTGIFVEIGQLPSTDYAKGLVEMTETNHIKIDPRNCKTSAKNIWAAGDCTDTLYHQNNIASGDAVRALEDIYIELKKQG